MNVRGKVAFITGAGSGIGRGMAEAFCDAGIKIVAADIDRGSADDTAAMVEAKGGACLPLALDVTDRSSWDIAAAEAEKKFGAVDILCNNAGVAGLTRPIEDIPIAEWRWLTDVNVFGIVHGLQCFIPRMKARRAGNIVNTSSIGGLVALPRFAEYMASKHAVVGLTNSLRAEVAPFGIGVSLLCPGAVKTSLGETTLRQRPSRKMLAAARDETVKAQAWRYIAPVEAGRIVLRGITGGWPYIFTHAENRAEVEARFKEMMESFDALTGA
jgi:NAD(P)-dependent dehydrogenase (short-subunit alcohol dehydrogenase family)